MGVGSWECLGVGGWALGVVLVLQSLTDSLVHSLAGGAIAIPLSFWCTRLVAARQVADLPSVRITLEPVTLVFALGCAVATGLIFGAVRRGSRPVSTSTTS